jgi:hypothetical protein
LADEGGPSGPKRITVGPRLPDEEAASRVGLQVLGVHGHIADEENRPTKSIEREVHQWTEGTIMERIQEAKAGFRSLTEAIDTTTPAGRMMMQMIGSFAEFERAMLRERTRAGLASARDEGRIGGRRPKLLPQQQTEVLKMVTRGKKTAADAARLFNVHPATIGRLLARASGDAAAAKR